jgi:NADH dehydrogenase
MIPRCIQKSHFPLRRIDAHRLHTRLSPLGLRFSTTSPTPTPTPSDPSRFSRYGRKAAKYTAFACFSTVLGLSVVIGGVLIHDVFTYSDKHIDRVPVSPLALHPELGGPKNLPVASVLVGDGDDGAQVPVMGKPKLVIVGGGWGVRYISFIHSVFLTWDLLGR